MTTLNNVASKTLFNAVFIRPEQVDYFVLHILQESSRINKEGELVVQSSRFRNQQKNLMDGVQKVREILENVSIIPNETSEDKKAKITEMYV